MTVQYDSTRVGLNNLQQVVRFLLAQNVSKREIARVVEAELRRRDAS